MRLQNPKYVLFRADPGYEHLPLNHLPGGSTQLAGGRTAAELHITTLKMSTVFQSGPGSTKQRAKLQHHHPGGLGVRFNTRSWSLNPCC